MGVQSVCADSGLVDWNPQLVSDTIKTMARMGAIKVVLAIRMGLILVGNNIDELVGHDNNFSNGFSINKLLRILVILR